MEETSEHTGSYRSLKVAAYGDTVEEIELDALDKARAFFGTDCLLHIERNYQVNDTIDFVPGQSGGKRYCSYVRVRVEENTDA